MSNSMTRSDRAKHRIFHITALFLLILQEALSYDIQEKEERFFFEHVGLEEGLSQLSILAILQDSEGYLWFATRNGINRYDGYTFTTYQKEVNDPTTLSDNYVKTIAEDNGHNLWIGTENGLNCMDPGSRKVVRFYPAALGFGPGSNQIHVLLTLKTGSVYAFCGKELVRCLPDKTIERVPFDKEGLPSLPTAAAECPNGDICIGTSQNGLYLYGPDWKQKTHVPLSKTATSKPVLHIRPDNAGNLWVGTEGDGIYRVETGTCRITRFTTRNSGLTSNAVRQLVPYKDTLLLAGTFNGLNIINTRRQSIHPARVNEKGAGGLSHFSIHSLLLDKEQTLWVGTYYGINYASPYNHPITFIPVASVSGAIGRGEEDQMGNLWFATEGSGLLRLNPRTNNQQLYPIQSEKSNAKQDQNIIKSILMKGDSILCSTHYGSIYLFSIRTKQYKKLYDFKYNDIYSLYLDHRERLWIPTNSEQRLIRIDREGVQTNYFPDNRQKEAYRFRGVTGILEIQSDQFLFGTLYDSLYLYNEQAATVTNLTDRLLPHSTQEKIGSIISLAQDSAGCLYIATSKNGLFRLSPQLQPDKHFQKGNGLPESAINALSIDRQNQLWVTTHRKIYRLQKDREQFEEMDLENVPPLEFTPYNGQCLASDGTLYFPGNKGILAFNPANHLRNPNPPKVRITALICNESDNLTKEIHDQTIRLEASQNNLAIHYTALNFIHAFQNQYTCLLEGAEEKWHLPNHRREVYYNNLAPGTYTFRLKAANNDGVWNPIETHLRIIIAPPFYQTTWAYFIYFILLVSGTYGFVLWQQRAYRRKQELHFKQREQERKEELHKEKIRLFTNFSHELRTPLTLIINPLDHLLNESPFSMEVRNKLLLIKKNTSRILLLVNQLMDIQKYEAGKMSLSKTVFDLNALVREMQEQFDSIAQNRHIHFLIDNRLPLPFYRVYMDRNEIEKLFFNLLSNAFKFTPSSGEVRLHIESLPRLACLKLSAIPEKTDQLLDNSRYIFLEVRDNGKGFSPEEASHIFEPFFRSQEDVHHQIAGSGIGLPLAQSIVRQHKGVIWAISMVGEGSSFRVLLPDTECQSHSEIENMKHQQTHLLLEQAASREHPTLLLVDDNTEILDYLKEQLSEDYHLVTASNGQEAWMKLCQQTPDLVIADLMMPLLNGIQLCQRLKNDPERTRIPIILLTARTLPQQIEEGLSAGADDYIVKPFQMPLLKARIKNLLVRQKRTGESLLEQVCIKTSDKGNEFLTRYIRIVRENIANPEMDITLICEQMGLSRSSFYRKVKEVTGLSPVDLVRNIRLETAAELLKASPDNIEEIARQVGFSNRSYFTRSFKKQYGISPSEYVQNRKKS